MLAATYTNDVTYVVSSLTTSPTTSLTSSLGTRPFTGGGRVCARCYNWVVPRTECWPGQSV